MRIMASLGILQRLDAASSLLRTQGGARNFAEISRGQSECIGEMLQEGRFAMAEVVQMTDKISTIPWATEAEKQHLLQRLSAASVVGSKRPRARMQNFEAIASFLTDAQWAVLTSGSCDFTAKLRCIADAACALGCRHPTEGTLATITALLLVCTEGADKARSMSAAYLHDVFVHTKSQMKARCRGAALEDIDELPVLAQDFRVAHPRTFEVAFGSSAPAACPIRISDVVAVVKRMPLRSRSAALQGVGAAQSQEVVATQFMQALTQLVLGAGAAPGLNLQILGGRGQATPPRPTLRPALGSAASFVASMVGGRRGAAHHLR